MSPSQRPLLNTQHSQQTNIHAPCGIRTHDLSRRAVADLRFRPRGYWDRQYTYVQSLYFFCGSFKDTFNIAETIALNKTVIDELERILEEPATILWRYYQNICLDELAENNEIF